MIPLVMIILYISIAFCSKFYFMLNDGVSYMTGVNGKNVKTTENKTEADIFEIKYNSATNKYTNIIVTTKGDLYWDIAANKTNLHYWKTDNMHEKQYFHLVYLPNDEVGVVNANGMCLEHKKSPNTFRREPCNFSNNSNQRFKIMTIDKDEDKEEIEQLQEELGTLKTMKQEIMEEDKNREEMDKLREKVAEVKAAEMIAKVDPRLSGRSLTGDIGHGSHKRHKKHHH